MKHTKKLLLALLAILLTFTSVPTQANAAAKIYPSSKMLNVGETVTLSVTGAKGKIKWSSSNKNVASVTQKGIVSAKKAGTATIKAKAAKKTLKCKITVEERFSANKATKNISCTLQDTGKGVVAILKNNNKITVSLSAKLVYYSNGKMIHTSNDVNYAFESGKECSMFFQPPYDKDYQTVEYDDFKITMSVQKAISNLICGSNKIGVTSDMGADKVTAEVKNNSGKDFEFIKVAVIFYDSSKNPIGYKEQYANCKTNGSSDFISFNFPYDEEHKTIAPDSYKTYVNFAYGYKH